MHEVFFLLLLSVRFYNLDFATAMFKLALEMTLEIQKKKNIFNLLSPFPMNKMFT